MKRPGRVLSVLAVSAVLASLAACGDKPQTSGANNLDVAAYQGAENKYVLPTWKVGDKTSWEQGLKARMQNTQNEYSKTN